MSIHLQIVSKNASRKTGKRVGNRLEKGKKASTGVISGRSLSEGRSLRGTLESK